MAKFSRRELDELGAVAVKAVRELRPDLDNQAIQRLFGRLYCNIYRDNKLEQQAAPPVKTGPLKPIRQPRKV